MKHTLLALLVAAFAVSRFFMPSHAVTWPLAYEAFAHILVGALFGALLATKKEEYFWWLVVLTIVESIAFFLLRGK